LLNINVVISSEAEYRAKASYLFENEKYDEAAMFFEKAQDIPNTLLSRAHSMMLLGRLHALEVQSKLHIGVHSGWSSIPKVSTVLISFICCLQNNKSDPELALAHAVLKQNTEHSKAAFRAYQQSADLFHQLQNFSLSAKAYKACGLFEEAIESLRAIRQYLPAFRLCFELKPLRTKLIISIGTQGALYRQLLEAFFTPKLLFTNVDHCAEWIERLRNIDKSVKRRYRSGIDVRLSRDIVQSRSCIDHTIAQRLGLIAVNSK
jgi:tetratricopeptide (TPR) repeat protein